MLSLFYTGLNGFLLMHACVNVRFLSPPGKRDHAHTSCLGTGWALTHMPKSLGLGRHGTGQALAKAGEMGTMEGCGVLF